MRRLHTFLPRDYKLLVGKERFFVKECPLKSSGVVKELSYPSKNNQHSNNVRVTFTTSKAEE